MNTSFRRIVSIFAVLTLGVISTGCVAFGGVDRNAAVIDTSVGAARNNAVLMNIVRASHHEPLYFYALTKVSGSGTEDMKFSLPAFTLGPRQAIAQQNYTFGLNGLSVLDSQHSGSFDSAPMVGKDFYAGMLAPLDLLEVNILLKQGYPRELIYRLVVQDVTIYGHKVSFNKGGIAYGAEGYQRLSNTPKAPGEDGYVNYLMFNYFLGQAMSHGITTETFMVSNGDGDAAASGGKKGGPMAWARLCFDPALYSPNSQEARDIANSGNVCGERSSVAAPEVAGTKGKSLEKTYKECPPPAPVGETNAPAVVVASSVGGANEQDKNRVCAYIGGQVFAIQLNTRSVFGMFDYLGNAVAKNSDIELTNGGADVEPHATGRLIHVVKDKKTGCFAVAESEGHYCVPADDSDNLKVAFSIINELESLKTSPGDLPVTTSVRIEP